MEPAILIGALLIDGTGAEPVRGRSVVIEDGRIADIGAHEELMKKLGTYRRLYDLQFVEIEQSKLSEAPLRQ